MPFQSREFFIAGSNTRTAAQAPTFQRLENLVVEMEAEFKRGSDKLSKQYWYSLKGLLNEFLRNDQLKKIALQVDLDRVTSMISAVDAIVLNSSGGATVNSNQRFSQVASSVKSVLMEIESAEGRELQLAHDSIVSMVSSYEQFLKYSSEMRSTGNSKDGEQAQLDYGVRVIIAGIFFIWSLTYIRKAIDTGDWGNLFYAAVGLIAVFATLFCC